MKENGIMITGMAEALRNTLMEIFIKENFNLERLMVKGDIIGLNQVKYMMENGQRVLGTDMEFGKKLIKLIHKTKEILT
jgi:hypothetical protein